MWDLWESTGNGPLVSPPVTKCRYAVSHAVRCLGRAPPTPLERPGREGPRADGVFASGASQQTSIIIITVQALEEVCARLRKRLKKSAGGAEE